MDISLTILCCPVPTEASHVGKRSSGCSPALFSSDQTICANENSDKRNLRRRNVFLPLRVAFNFPIQAIDT